MRDYSKVRPTFWTKGTGKRLRGDSDAQRVAFYLMTGPQLHMTGLYYLPLPTLMHEVGISLEGATEALRRLEGEGFAYFDFDEELVWLPNGAREQIGESLKPADNNIKAICKHLAQFSKHSFFNEFLKRYKRAYHLPLSLAEATAAKPLVRPLQPPSDTLRSQEQDQEQDQEREQDQDQARAPARAHDTENVSRETNGLPNLTDAEPWMRLWKAWERVSANGMPCGDARSHEARLTLAWDACEARDASNPVGVFECAAKAFLADCAQHDKRPSLIWLCSQFGQWADPKPAKPEPQRPSGAAYQPIEPLE